MKILVDASLLSYGKAATYAGFQAFLHNTQAMSTFDTFDKINPDIYIADSNYVTEAVLKNIEERPALKVVFIEDQINNSRKKIEDRFGNIYSFKQRISIADLIDYSKPEKINKYEAALVAIDETVPENILNMKFPKCFIFRIFSGSIINDSRYCGALIPNRKKNIYKSSSLSIATGDNFYNSALCDCLPIFPETVEDVLSALQSNNSKILKSIKEEAYSKHNNFDSLSEILNELGYDKEANTVLEKAKELK
jgi:hypothetical protein